MKRGQMKIQEMAFVLLALVLLAIIGFVFVLKLSQQKLIESAENIKAKTTISLLERISNLPELECYCKPSCRANCIDEDKTSLFKEQLNQNPNLAFLFQGISSARIVRIYPYGEDIQIYQSIIPSNASSYSTFINLCKYETSGSFRYNCGIAMLVARGV